MDTRQPSRSSNLLPPPDLQPIFEQAARRYNVPVNVLMAIGHQESSYNAQAVGPETKWGRARGMMQYLDSTAKGMGINPFVPEQAVGAAAKQIRERLDKGYSIEDAVKEHFAGPNRKLWGPKTAAYGTEVMGKVAQINELLGGQVQPERPAPQSFDPSNPSAGLPPASEPLSPAQNGLPEPAKELGAWDTTALLGKQLWDAAVYHLPASVAAAMEGDDPFAETDWKDSLIQRGRKRAREGMTSADEGTSTAIPGISAQDMKSLGPSLGFSATGMGAGIGVGLPAAAGGSLVAPGVGTAAGMVAGGAASGAVAYRMATNNFVRDLREIADLDAMQQGKPKLTDAEFSEKMAGIQDSVREYGLWEAVPEAASNVIGFGVLKAPVKTAIGKFFGKNVVTRLGTKAASIYGTELATETVTEQGQNNVMADVGQEFGAKNTERRSWTSAEDLGESFKEIAPTTILQTTILAGGTKSAMMLQERIKRAGLTPDQYNALMELNDLVERGQFDPEGARLEAVRLLDPNAQQPQTGQESEVSMRTGEAPGISISYPQEPSRAAEDEALAKRSTATGPLSRSIENAAEGVAPQQRVTVTAPEGQISGIVDTYETDGQGGFMARVVGDDGMVYNFTHADGVQIDLEAPAPGPLTAAVEDVAQSVGAADAAPDNAAGLPIPDDGAGSNTGLAGEQQRGPQAVAQTEDPASQRQAGAEVNGPDNGAGVPGADVTADGQPALEPVDPETARRREVAEKRIQSGTAYFGTPEKAQNFIDKAGIGDAYEVVQTGKVRFELKAKDAQDVDNQRAEQQPNGAEAVEQEAGQGQADGTAVQPVVEPDEIQVEVTRQPIEGRDIPKAQDTAITSTGMEVPVRYKVVEVDDLIASQTDTGQDNPNYPQDMQPRDRDRFGSVMQINEIATTLNPRLLDRSPKASDGAPIIAPDGVVESGNGRTLALRKAYRENLPGAQAYRDYLAEQGYPVDGMRNPVLVRVREGEMDYEQRQTFTRDANDRDTLAMSATERAVADAATLRDNVLDLYVGGDVDLSVNRPFVRGFIDAVVSTNDRGAMIAPDGTLSQEAYRRVQAALLAKAYGAPDLVGSLIESLDNNIRAIGGALMDIAARWSRMRMESKNGTIDQAMDQTERLVEAVRIVQRARREDRSVGDFVNQTDIFSGETVNPVTEGFLRLMFRNDKQWKSPAGRDRIVQSLTYYLDQADRAQPGVDLLGTPAPDANQVLRTAKERQYADQQEGQQQDILAQPDGGTVGGAEGSGSTGVNPIQQEGQARGSAENAGSGQQAEVAEPQANGRTFGTLYHGTAREFDNFTLERAGKGAGYRHQGDAVYLTSDKDGYGRFFAQAAAVKAANQDKSLSPEQADSLVDSGGVVMSTTLDPNAKILDMREGNVDPQVADLFARSVGDLGVGRQLTKRVRELGYDGIAFIEPNAPDGWELQTDALTAAVYNPAVVRVDGAKAEETEQQPAKEAKPVTSRQDGDGTTSIVIDQAATREKKPKQEPMPTESFDSKAGVGKIFAVKERYGNKYGISWSSTDIATADTMEEAAAIAKAVAESGADNIADMRAVAREAAAAKPADNIFAKNKIFTQDKVEAARARLKSKLSQLNSGIDPEVMIDGMTIAGAYIEGGVREFSAYAKAMVNDFGDAIKPYLLSFYEGARNYPGLNTEGMSSVDDARRMHTEMIKPADLQTEAVGQIAKKPANRTKKTGAKTDMTLTQDWGVDAINGYSDDVNRDTGNTVKDAFLKEARAYLNAVAGVLTEQGYTPHTDARGRPEKMVSVNESGVAGSGDVTLTLAGPDGIGAYVHISETSLRGVVPTTPSGIAVMFRAASNSDRFGAKGQNEWAPVDLSAADLAAMVDKVVKFQSANAARGNTIPRGEGNANTVQPENVPARDPVQGAEDAATGNRDSQPVGTGMAEGGQGSPDGGQVPGSTEGTRGTGTRGAERAGQQPSGETRDRPGVRAESESSDFVVDANEIGQGGLPKKYRDNVAAIKILKAMESEGRVATPDERKQLAKYVGWGAMKGPFDPQNNQWAKQHAELKELLTDAEFKAARRSTLDAHYTSPIAIGAMNSALERLGYNGGRLLEPSVGVGNFFGLMPASMRNSSQLYGVELDSLTSRMVAALYPKAKIAKATGFEDYQIPSEFFDVVQGNPPFGSQPLVDSERSPYSGFSIHNYFLAKGIDKLRPGGIMQVVVSHSFLDAQNSRARQWIAERANLIGAVRLPNTAFKDNAGTEVVTDILIFQKKDSDGNAAPNLVPDWVSVGEQVNVNPKTGESATHKVSPVFLKNPDLVLGKPSAGGSMYSANEYTVESTGDIKPMLDEWVKELPEGIYQPVARKPEASTNMAVPDGVKVGSFFVDANGDVVRRGEDVMGDKTVVPWTAPNAKAAERVKGMIGLRETLRNQMRLERSPDATEAEIEQNRATLNRLYDEFLAKNGHINNQINRRLFLDDTESQLIQALEFDYDKGVSKAIAERDEIEQRPPSATKADIFKRRVAFPPQDFLTVTTAKDALLASMNYRGKVDPDYMTEVYGKPIDKIVEELGDVVYDDPQAGLVTADQYLSGDVKTKLADAQSAAQSDAKYKRNVEALEKVIPVDKKPSEIMVGIGAAFVPAEVYEQFINHISGGNAKAEYVKATGQWLVDFKGGTDPSLNTGKFGTERLSAQELFQLSMLGRGAVVKQTIKNSDGTTTTVVLEKETEGAREKQNAIKAEWQSWLWNDPARAEQIASIYNDKLNRIVTCKYDGNHMTFPGMNPAITLLEHQKNGVWRGLQSYQVLYDHVVGAGKTFEMATLAMEMRRLGIARKPLFIVPNHLTLQWMSEFTRLYPGSNILAATPDDFSKGSRERMFSKIITGDWDSVIIGHSSLKKIGLPEATEKAVLQEQIDEVSEAIEDIKRARGDRNIIRDMEGIRARIEARMKDKLAAIGQRDKVVTFDELGIDAMFIDEMHEFKNLAYNSTMDRVPGMGNPNGSDKAFDLFVKTRWMFDTFGEKTPYVTATGTPISNSLVEMYNMQRYMQYPTLKAQGLHVFDAWARQFAKSEQVYEVTSSGVGYRQSTRFGPFANLPGLMSLYNSFADTITLDDLKAQEESQGNRFPVPKIAGGRPQNVVAKRSPEVAAFMGMPAAKTNEDGSIKFMADLNAPIQIEQSQSTGKWVAKAGDSYFGEFETEQEARLKVVERALTPEIDVDPESILGRFGRLKDLTKATKGKVNALSLTGEANKAGLDYRLIDPSAPDFPGSKINLAVDNMIRVYKQWKKDKGTQLVFSDLSIPLSARASYSSKSRRLYVRGDTGAVEMKRGTMHTLEGQEAFPYFIVQRGEKELKRFDVYDAVSGVMVGREFRSKQDAVEDANRQLSEENSRQAWLSRRESYGELGQDQIDEYNNDNEIETDKVEAFTREDIAGVSGASQFSVYDDIKAKLVAKGVPEREIAFIHDYSTPAAKDKLFKAVNNGDIRFLLGSTPKMGAGTNVQKRLVGLHHIDAPWRPSDLEQREGRIIRRGNDLYNRDPDGFEVFIGRYATEQTYDTRRWQILEHKARGIEQLRNFDGTVNEIDDIEGEAANAADMKAAASGDPLILEETRIRNEVRRLEQLQAAHADDGLALNRKAKQYEDFSSQDGPRTLADLKTLTDAARKNPLDKDGFAAITIDGKKFAVKESAQDEITKVMSVVRSGLKDKATIVYRGIEFSVRRTGPVTMADSPTGNIGSWSGAEPFSASGFVQRMKNYVDRLPDAVADIDARVKKARGDAMAMREQAKAPFAQSADLESAREEYKRVQRALLAKGPSVPDSQKAAVLKGLDAQKNRLRVLGFEEQLNEFFGSTEPRYSVRDDGITEAEFGPVYTGLDAQEAVDRLMTEGTGEAIVSHPELGDVSLVYGDASAGLEHIADRRGDAIISRLPEILSNGKVYAKPGQKGRVFVGTDRDEAVMRLDWNGQAKTWLLSAYEKYPDLKAGKPERKSNRSQTIAQRTDAGLTVAQARDALTTGVLGPVMDGMISRGMIVLHKSAKSLPKGIGQNVRGIQAVTTPDNKVHIVASTLTQENARAVALHEMFHRGGERLIGTVEWGKLMGRLGSLRRQAEKSNGKAREFYARAEARVQSARAQGAVSIRMENEEFGAYAIEEYERARQTLPAVIRKWVEDLIGMVKAWAIKSYGKQLGQVTPAQLSALAKLAVMDMAADTTSQPSNMAFSAAPPVDTPAFKRWFGKSKVVDADGKPLVVYHGSTNAIRDVIDAPYFYMTESIAEARAYSGDQISPATGERRGPRKPPPTAVVGEFYVKIENPFISDRHYRYFVREADYMRDQVAEWIAEGYDGVIMPWEGEFGGVRNFIVFDSSQVKSATGNNGNFDPANPDIRYSLKPSEHFEDLTDKQKDFLNKIGREKLPVRLADQWKQWTERLGLRIRQAGVDRYAALLENDQALYGEDTLEGSIASSGWVLARMSHSAGGAMSAMLDAGRIYLDPKEKVIDVREDTTGLKAMFNRLGSPQEIDRFMAWVAANRASSLMEQGRENLFTESEIKAGIKLAAGETEDGKKRPFLYSSVWKEFQQFRDDVLGIAEQSGTISPEQREMWSQEFYVPFYRVLEDETFAGPTSSSGLTRQQAYKRLKGGKQNLNDLLENTLLNFHHLIQTALKNQAAQQSIENAIALGIARPVSEQAKDKKLSTFVMVGGDKQWYDIDDPMTFKALSALNSTGLNHPLMKVGRAFKRLFTNMVTATPQFVLANTLRDSLSAMATSPTSGVPLANAVKGAMIYGNSKNRASMLASGASFSFGHVYGQNPDELKASLKGSLRKGKLLKDPALIPSALLHGWRKWNEVTDFAENINRAGIWERNLKKGKLKAAFEARDLMDFSAHGDALAVRMAIDLTPFLNARAQGVDKLYRSGIKPGAKVVAGRGTKADKKSFGRFSAVVGALSLFSAILYLLNKDDEEYRKLEDWQRDSYWFIRFGENAFFIPKPFEVGAIATLVERGIEQFVDPTVGGKKFAERLGHMLTDTFALDLPQIIKPVYELSANRNTFTGRPIEDIGMQRLSPSLRVRPETTRLSEGASRAMEAIAGDAALSPVEIDHLIGAYLGQIGASAAGLTDVMWRRAMGEQLPARRWNEYQPIRRFYRDLGAPAPYTRYATDFYNALKEADKAYANIQHLLKYQEFERADTMIEKEADKLDMRTALNRVQRDLSQINSQMRQIQIDKTMTSEEKRLETDRLRDIKNTLTEAVGKELERVRASAAERKESP